MGMNAMEVGTAVRHNLPVVPLSATTRLDRRSWTPASRAHELGFTAFHEWRSPSVATVSIEDPTRQGPLERATPAVGGRHKCHRRSPGAGSV